MEVDQTNKSNVNLRMHAYPIQKVPAGNSSKAVNISNELKVEYLRDQQVTV